MILDGVVTLEALKDVRNLRNREGAEHFIAEMESDEQALAEKLEIELAVWVSWGEAKGPARGA